MAAYNRNKDIVASWSQPRTNEVRAPANANGWTPTAERTTLCFFSGNLGLEKPWGEDYSRGLRQTIARSWQNVSGFDILMHSNDYLERIGSSKFCLALPGDGWSGGLSVYIRNGCVPVIVQDGVDMPWKARSWIIRNFPFAFVSETSKIVSKASSKVLQSKRSKTFKTVSKACGTCF